MEKDSQGISPVSGQAAERRLARYCPYSCDLSHEEDGWKKVVSCPEVHRRVAPALAIVAWAIDRGVEAARHTLDRGAAERDAARLRDVIANHWYPHALFRHCECTCRKSDDRGFCGVHRNGLCDIDDCLSDGDKDHYLNRRAVACAFGLAIGRPLRPYLPSGDFRLLLEAADREVAEEVLGYGADDEKRVYGFASREESVVSEVFGPMPRCPHGMDMRYISGYEFHVFPDDGGCHVTLSDANGETVTAVHGIPDEESVVNAVARAVMAAPDLWPRSVAYGELEDACDRLVGVADASASPGDEAPRPCLPGSGTEPHPGGGDAADPMDWDPYEDVEGIDEMSVYDLAGNFGIDYALWRVGNPHLL